jgi:hypothetical protein
MSEKIELDELQIRDIETLAGYLTINKIADYLGIDERTFHRLKKRDERVLSAYRRGVSRAEGMASNNIRKFMQYDNQEEGEEKPNIARLQMQLDATKFYLNTKSKWSKQEEKKIKFDIPEGVTPLDILDKITNEIRDGNITLSEIKQLIELAQVRQQLLAKSDSEEQEQKRYSLEECLEISEKLLGAADILEKKLGRKSNEQN